MDEVTEKTVFLQDRRGERKKAGHWVRKLY